MKTVAYVFWFLSLNLQAETLTEVIQQTLETNPNVLISMSHYRAAKQQLNQAKAGYWPEIELTGGYGREISDNAMTRNNTGEDITLNRRELGLSLSQTLYDGFKVKNQVKQTQSLTESTYHQIKQSSENIALLTAKSYLDVLRRQALLELNKDNIVIHQKILTQIQLLVDSGAGRQADLQQSASRLALAKSSLVNAQGNLRQAEINYRQVTGQLPKVLIFPDRIPLEEALPDSAEAALDIALNHHPELQKTYAELKVAQAVHQQIKSSFWPRITLELGITDNKNLDGIAADNDEISAMIRMRYNLYRGGADQARFQETVEQIESAKQVIRRNQRLIEEETLLSWNTLMTTRARLEYLKIHVESTEQVLSSYKEQFKLGQRSLLDVLDSENELFNARASLVSARYAEMFSMISVLENIGQLLETLGIRFSQETQTNPLLDK